MADETSQTEVEKAAGSGQLVFMPVAAKVAVSTETKLVKLTFIIDENVEVEVLIPANAPMAAELPAILSRSVRRAKSGLMVAK